MNVFIHPSSDVSPKATIGKGSKIWQSCTILAGATIGSNCLLSKNVYIEGGVCIGNNVKIKNNVALFDSVILEDEVFVGPGAVFTNVLRPRSFVSRKHVFQPTVIKRGATLGANCTILCGIIIGCYAMIGAGAVVVKNVQNFELVAGNPAKHIGWVCVCGEKLARAKASPQWKCSCGKCYQEFARRTKLKQILH